MLAQTARVRVRTLRHSQRAPCSSEHTELKENDELWTAAPFGGIQPLGCDLGEGRHCPVCGSTVLRPVSLGRALAMLMDELIERSPPSPIATRSAMALVDWANHYMCSPTRANLPTGNGGGVDDQLAP